MKLIHLDLAFEGLTESLVGDLDPTWNIKVTCHRHLLLSCSNLVYLSFLSKVTILEPGPYRTEISEGNYRDVPPHPAYADSALPASQVRKFLASPHSFDGDVAKAVVVVNKVSQLEDAPIRFPLHKKLVADMRDKAKGLSEVADKYESWTDDLYHAK